MGRQAERLAHDAIRAVYCSPLSGTVGDGRGPREAARSLARAPRRAARDQPWPLGRPHATGGRGTFGEEYAAWEADPFNVRSRRRRERARRSCPRLPVVREIVVSARGRDHPGRLTQGNPPACPLQPARLRSPRLPGPPGSVPGLPERSGLLRSSCRPAPITGTGISCVFTARSRFGAMDHCTQWESRHLNRELSAAET